MLRRATAVVIGLMVGVLLVAVIEAASVVMYPPPPGADLSDDQVLQEFFRSRPTGALLVVLAAYAVGSFGAAVTAASISEDQPRRPALTVGSLLLIAGILNLLQRPYPFWFAATSMLVYLPCAWLGGMLVEWWRGAPNGVEAIDSDD
ncbi:MAG: hypothetical protein JJ992_27725 [Planctomycetes bacterium]|nr:hypothetical protein [Planctomycetota bacterium]